MEYNIVLLLSCLSECIIRVSRCPQNVWQFLDMFSFVQFELLSQVHYSAIVNVKRIETETD